MEQLAIEVDQLSKHFVRPLPRLRKLLKRRGPDVVQALSGVTLSVHAGEVFGLVGRNGQGKTTLIKSACGLLEPSAGQVRVFGFDTVQKLAEVKRRVGLVSADERSFYYRLSGLENLLFFGRLYGMDERSLRPRIARLAERFELEPVLERRFQEYSSGNKQRLAIVRALLPDPPLLLLDEPTRSLDPISAVGLRRALAEWASGGAERTVLITTHNLAEVELLCQRVAILSRGRVIECATLETLRAKYVRDEQVDVQVRGEVRDEFLLTLRRELGEVQCERHEDGRSTLRISRRADDERLHALLQRATGAGLVIVDCDTQRFGLMQVLETIEARAVDG